MDIKNMNYDMSAFPEAIEVTVLNGAEVMGPVAEVSKFRIKYFSDYPYLYKGNLSYEKEYMEGFAVDANSMLILLRNRDDQKLVGVSTSMSFDGNIDILGDVVQKFKDQGFDPSELYYYGEVIIDYNYRGKGLVKKIYDLHESYAKGLGHKKIVITTVERASDDSRRPIGYIDSDSLWDRLGFKKTSIKTQYEWPTVLDSGSVELIKNPMIFWVKEIGGNE